jgi:hypothetical protein
MSSIEVCHHPTCGSSGAGSVAVLEHAPQGAKLQKRGVGLKVLTGDVDTTTATGRLVFGIFATLAEFERDLIYERTMAGRRRPAREVAPAGARV